MRHLLFWCALLVSRLGATATADVHLTVEAWPGFAVELHQPITFRITVANDGPDEAPNVVAFSSSFNPLIILKESTIGLGISTSEQFSQIRRLHVN